MRRIVDLNIKGHYHVDVPMADSWAYIKTFGAVPFYVNGIYEGVEEYGNMLYTSRPAEQTDMDMEFSGSTNAFNFTTNNAGWVKYVSQLLIRNDIKLKWISVDNYLNSNEEVLCCPFVIEKDCFNTRDVNIAPVLNSDGRYYWHFDAALNEQNICLLGFTEFAEDEQEFNFQFCFESDNDMGVWDEEEDAKFAIVKQVLYPVTFDNNMTVATHGEVLESGDEVRRGSRLVLSHETLPDNIFLYYEVNGERLDGSNIIVNEALDINAVYVEVAVQSVSESIGNYNPAVSIVLERNNIGTYVDNDDHTKGWYLSKADAAERTTIPAFTNITSVADANGIVVESEGDVTKTYDFTEFEELQYFGITSFPDGCFWNCTLLQSAILPNTIQRIDVIYYGIFENCTALTDINIPDSVTVIGTKTFNRCTSLAIDITGKMSNVTTVGALAFYNTKISGVLALPNLSSLTLFSYQSEAFYNTNITAVTDLGSITSLPSGTFRNCKYLTNVTLPNGLKYLSSSYVFGAFESCTALTDINIPDSVTDIGAKTFNLCTSLAIDITGKMSNVTTVGARAFYNTKISGVLALPNLLSLGIADYVSGAFYNTDITEIASLGNITSLPGSTFSNCKSLTKVTLPNTLTNLSSYAYGAFEYCSALTEITIPQNVTDIASNAFIGCNALMSITSINTSVPTLGSGALYAVPTTCPIYVPAASVSAYQAASGWSDRAAYIQAISGNFEVTLGANVTAVDQDSNVVNSGDTVAAGTVLTLTATTVAGQTFDHFTVNGTAITGSSYTVNEAVTIEAVYTTE